MPPLNLYDQTLARLYGNTPDQVADPSIYRQPQQPSPIQPLSPQDESTILDKIGSTAASGLGYIGGSLGKAFGGRAIRGLLGGRPQELASVIPFSDTLGITDPSNEVTGAELLGNKHADLLSPEGIGGIAAEILLDPATYLSLGSGAVTKLGGLAQKAGVLPKNVAGRVAGLAAASPEADTLARYLAGTTHAIGPTTPQQIAEVAGKTLGGHVGVGLPFMGNAATFDLRPAGNALLAGLDMIPGGAAIKGVGSAIGQAADPFVRGARALFDRGVAGQTDPWAQKVIKEQYSNLLPQALVQARQEVRPTVEAAHAAGLLNEPGGAVLRDVFEGATPAGPLQGLKDAQQELMRGSQRTLQESMLPATEFTPQTIRSGPGAGEQIDYAHRQLAREEFPGVKGARPKVLAPSEEQARLKATEGMTANRLKQLAEEDMTALNPKQIEEKIRTDYVGLPHQVHVDRRDLLAVLEQEQAAAAQARQTMTAATEMAGRKQLMPDLAAASQSAEQQLASSTKTIEATKARINEIDERLIQAKDLAKYKMEGTVPIFNHPVEDLATKLFKDKQRALKADAFHYGVAGLAMPQAEAGQGAMSFVEALQRGGLTPEGNQLLQKTKDALEKQGKSFTDLANMYVRKEDLQPFLNFMEGTRTPKGLEPFLNLWDSVTNLTKAWQTAAWPGNWSRNFLTDQFMHWVVGGSSSPLAMIKDLQDARILHGGTGILQDANKIPGLTHLSPQEATKEIQRMMVDRGVMGQGRLLADTVGAAGEGTRLESLIPGLERQGPVGAYKKALQEGTYNPFDVRGFAGREQDTNKLIKGGRQVNETLSDISRVQTFLGKLRQGFTPEMAYEAVVKAHYDFSNMSQFERDVLRRVVPFYSWARQNVPTVLQEVATSPGGRLANTIKASGKARGDEPGFLPPAIGEGLALPIGPEENGTQRFFSHTGLPFEDLAQMTTGKDILGMLNPLIKAPLEQLTHQQFFTGRDLRDLRSQTGFQPLDNAIMNSPLGRFMTTGQTITDDRKDVLAKAVNLLSGTHLTDENMTKAKDIAVRNYIEEQLRGQPEIGQHISLYPRADQVQNLSPQEMLLLRLQRTREAEARQQNRPIGVRR